MAVELQATSSSLYFLVNTFTIFDFVAVGSEPYVVGTVASAAALATLPFLVPLLEIYLFARKSPEDIEKTVQINESLQVSLRAHNVGEFLNQFLMLRTVSNVSRYVFMLLATPIVSFCSRMFSWQLSHTASRQKKIAWIGDSAALLAVKQ